MLVLGGADITLRTAVSPQPQYCHSLGKDVTARHQPLRKEGHEASTYTVKTHTKQTTNRNPDAAALRTALSAESTELTLVSYEPNPKANCEQNVV